LTPSNPRLVRILIVVVGLGLYVYGSDARGLLSADEPRYASIARTMAESGDWTTPRLDGEPWLEKPALLYWMGAAADRLGVQEDLATRLPVGLLAVAFLLLFHARLRSLFGDDAAALSTAVLGTSAGFAAYSNAGVFDLPLTASVGAALLCLLDWAEDESRDRLLPAFGALLGLSVLAKGLVGPAVAALAVLSIVRNRGVFPVAKALFAPRVLGPFLLVAGPWYLLCYLANGQAFIDEFLWKHHVERLYSSSLEHVQPWWFYLPVFIAALLPWTPLLAALRIREISADSRLRFFAYWALGTLLFFSVSTNKLPGYILPALPPVAALIGTALARRGARAAWFALSAATLAATPLAGAILPQALADGITRAWPPESLPWLGLAAALAALAAVTLAASSGRPKTAAGILALSTAAALFWLRLATFPALDRAAGSRSLWYEISHQSDQICIDHLRRHVRYGLAFYSRNSLPTCEEDPRPKVLSGDPPELDDTSFSIDP